MTEAPKSGEEHRSAELAPIHFITPDILTADNRSEAAREGIAIWKHERDQGNLTIVFACGDARNILPYQTTLSVRSIATGGPKGPYHEMVNNPAAKDALVVGHYNGATVRAGRRVQGCGGLGAKEDIGDKISPNGIANFVGRHIQSPDVVLQTIASARDISRHFNPGNDKPVLAAIEDHRTGKIDPLAVISKGGREITINADITKMNDPRVLYENGIPALDLSLIPDHLRQQLLDHEKHIAEVKMRYPNIEDLNEVQNPEIILITTEVISAMLRYPNQAKRPGSIFKLNAPRKETSDGKIRISKKDSDNIANQFQYPIEHSVDNHGTNKQFSRTSTVLIETESLNSSAWLARKLTAEAWMQKWLSLTGHQIIIAEVQSGNTINAQQFAPRQAA